MLLYNLLIAVKLVPNKVLIMRLLASEHKRLLLVYNDILVT